MRAHSMISVPMPTMFMEVIIANRQVGCTIKKRSQESEDRSQESGVRKVGDRNQEERNQRIEVSGKSAAPRPAVSSECRASTDSCLLTPDSFSFGACMER